MAYALWPTNMRLSALILYVNSHYSENRERLQQELFVPAHLVRKAASPARGGAGTVELGESLQ